MAHKRELTDTKCLRCVRRASWEVFNRYNASHGKYCYKHATELVASLKAEEEEARKGRIRKSENEAGNGGTTSGSGTDV